MGAGLPLTSVSASSRTVHYNPTSTKHFSFSVGAVPRALQPQLGVLKYFASYMEQRLMKVCEQGRVGWCGVHSGLTHPDPLLVPFGGGWTVGWVLKLEADPQRRHG